MDPTAFDEAFQRVQQLAHTFHANEKRYLSPDYQEAEARKDFIDKFWIALGWDVNHDAQTNPYEQEVEMEGKWKGQWKGQTIASLTLSSNCYGLTLPSRSWRDRRAVEERVAVDELEFQGQ